MPLDKYNLEIHSKTQKSCTRVIGLYLICFYFAEHFLILFFLGKNRHKNPKRLSEAITDIQVRELGFQPKFQFQV